MAGAHPRIPGLEASWARCWTGLRARGDGLALRDALLARWAEPHRRYHTLQHLAECLGHFDAARLDARKPHEVEMALWFHDAVYDVPGSDNEARSAAWAVDALVAAGVARGTAARVHRLVMHTQHAAEPRGHDARLLVDIDLAILGAPPARFAEFEQQIRAEYGHVPDAQFRARRCAVLQSFLDRPAIYGSAWFCVRFNARLERRARSNLRRAIAALR